MPELNSAAGSILRSDIIDTVYDAGLSDYEDYEEEDRPSQRLYGPTLQSLGIKSDYGNSYSHQGQEEIITDDNNFEGLFYPCNICFTMPLFLDIDDDEIASYILSENEAHLKSNIWMKRNGPHLEEMEKKFVCFFMAYCRL